VKENTSGLHPVAFNVLVKPKEVEAKTAGGLLLAESTVEKEEFGRTEGTLIAISPGAFTENYFGWPEDATRPKVGDEVMFSKYRANEMTGRDGGKYWMMQDRDIAAVVSA
jgi:chaperonin GroES